MSFLKPVDLPQSILLETCPPDIAKDMEDICRHLTRARMTEIVKMYVPLAAGAIFSFGPYHYNLSKLLQEWLTDRYRGYIDPQRELLPHLLYGPNLKKATDAWPANLRAVITYALNNSFIGLEKIRQIISENPEKITLASGRQTYVTPEMALSMMNTDLSGIINLYSVIPQVARMVGQAMGLQSFSGRSRTTDILPEGRIETFSGEGDLLGKFEVFKSIIHSNGIGLTGTGTGIRTGDVTAIAAALNLADPFAKSEHSQFKKFRARAAAVLLLTARASYLGKYTVLPDMLRAGLKSLEYTFLVNCALPHFDKFGKTNFYEMSGRRFLSAITAALARYAVRNLPADKHDVWIDCDDLVDEILTGLPVSERFGIDLEAIKGYSDVYDNITLTKVQVANVVNSFTKPLIKGIIAFLASAGLVEMAYLPSALNTKRPYDAIKYVRLTGLGRYAMCCDIEYIPRGEFEMATASVELDADNMIVRVLNDEASLFIKNQIGRKISSNRYIVNEATITRKIQTRTELENRVAILKEMAAVQQLPPAWLAMVNHAGRRLGAIKAERISDWCMYALDTKLPELVELLRTHPYARRLILMVEGGRFLVKNSDVAELRGILTENGFSLPAPAKERSIWEYDD